MSPFRTTELSNPTYENDGLRFLTVKSANLRGRGDVCLYVPETERTDLPIYILLHGVYGSSWSWAMQGGAHVTARRLMAAGEIEPAILAMPSDGLWGDGSGYVAHHERDFERWIVEDVPLAVRENIAVAKNNKRMAIGGLSMGGFGALRLGGLHPDKFFAISGHSSVTRLAELVEFVEEPVGGYGDGGGAPDVIDALLKNRATLPPLRFDCGLADSLLPANRSLHEQLTRAGITHTYREFAGGHTWDYWAAHVAETLVFFDSVG